jgi:pseudouridine-5'-phosphate glycosidase
VHARLTSRSAMQNELAIVVHPDVQKALRERQPVVALESTIISHGMPYPQNLQTALEVEDIVRQGEFPQHDVLLT